MSKHSPLPDPARAAFHRGLAAHTDVCAAAIAHAVDVADAVRILDRIAADQRRNAREHS